MEEVGKCQPICANCHRGEHYEKYTTNPEQSAHSKTGKHRQSKLSKREADRKRKKNAKRRREGRDDDTVPGPTPKK